MALHDMFDKCEDYTQLNDGFEISWSKNKVGFGSFYFRVRPDGTVGIDNEMMGKNFIKTILCDMVDAAILDDPE